MTDFLDIGFDILTNATAVIQGSNVEGIFNTAKFRDNKVLGGYEPDIDFSFLARTGDLTNPKSLKGVQITVDGDTLRIVTVEYGAIITKLYCQSVDKL